MTNPLLNLLEREAIIRLALFGLSRSVLFSAIHAAFAITGDPVVMTTIKSLAPIRSSSSVVGDISPFRDLRMFSVSNPKNATTVSFVSLTVLSGLVDDRASKGVTDSAGFRAILRAISIIFLRCKVDLLNKSNNEVFSPDTRSFDDKESILSV